MENFYGKIRSIYPNIFLKGYQNFIVEPDSLLIALTRPITNNTVKICLYPKDAPPELLNQRVAILKTILNFEKGFLLYYLQSDFFKEQISLGLAETLQPNLSPLKMGTIFYPLPTPCRAT